jgi:hypothetical protein
MTSRSAALPLGPSGAAVKLGLKRTTLQDKMQRSRISRALYALSLRLPRASALYRTQEKVLVLQWFA